MVTLKSGLTNELLGCHMSVEGSQLQFVKTQDIEDKSSWPVSQAAYYISVHDIEDITLSTGLKECCSHAQKKTEIIEA
jgi:hypothetical protein